MMIYGLHLQLTSLQSWLGLGKDHGLGSNDHFVKVREMWFDLMLLLRHHGSSKHHWG